MVQRPNFFRGDAILKFWQRIIAAVACAAMLIGLGLDAKSPISVQAEALGPAALPVAALAAFVTAAGINWQTKASADQVPGLISRLWGEYSDATGAGDLDTIATGHLSVNSLGRIIVAPTLVAAWQKFVGWLQSDKSVAVNHVVTVVPSDSYILSYQLGTDLPDGITWLSDHIYFNVYVIDSKNRTLELCSTDGNRVLSSVGAYTSISPSFNIHDLRFIAFVENNHLGVKWCWADGAGTVIWSDTLFKDYNLSRLGIVVSDSPCMDLVGASAIDVPGQGLADTDSVALDVGATAGATADDIAAAVAAGIAAGTFTASATVEAVEPIPGGNGDIDGLGLPSLGALLTTRFPFSIPWDVHAVVSMLSAEATAPYWQVDLMAPLKSRGKKFAGDTTITIDLTGDRWAVIGQVSRWGTLIGFCFALAIATKRLIWTA